MQSTDNSGEMGETTVEHLLRKARMALSDRLEADLLACQALGRERSWLYAHGRDAVGPDVQARLEDLLEQRLAGHPVAQLLGGREFYGREFRIDERVLIPRPETELLVELALGLPLPEHATACDIGTGSGCIALTLAAERPGWRVTGIDASEDALVVAAENRARLGLDAVGLLQSDLFEAAGERRFDVVVSNPPYIAEGDPHLKRGDLRFEPRLALVAGPDGLDLVRRLIPAANEHLEPGGWLLLEHGHDQAAAVRSLFADAGFTHVSSHRDLAGIERVTLGRRGAPADP